MRAMIRTLVVLAASLAMFVSKPAPARADIVKAGIFTLGVHLGNADGVLWGLLNSYDTSVRAHPGAPRLLKRLLKDAGDLAKVLGTPSDGIFKLEKDLDSMTFAEMRTTLAPLLAEQGTALAAKYPSESVAIYTLGRQLTMTTMFSDHPRNFLPEKVPNYKPGIAANTVAMKNNIVGNKLEATVSLTDDLAKRLGAGDSYASMAAFLRDPMLPKWTDDFLKAPPFGASGVGTLIVNVAGTIAKTDSKDRVRTNMHARVHEVNLRSGLNYVIDLESGNGAPGLHNPGYFDTWLRVEDGSGKELAYNDDGGDGFNSRLTFVPTSDGVYRLVVTTYTAGATGSYTLKVRQK